MARESIVVSIRTLSQSRQAPGIAPMSTLLTVPIEITAQVHRIKGGGYWAEVPSLPGCVAQADTLEALRGNVRLAVADWMAQSAVKTHEEASQLAAIQGVDVQADQSFPQCNEYRPPAAWTDEDE
jgi:predicted RNase H-like HicB family nuclease